MVSTANGTDLDGWAGPIDTIVDGGYDTYFVQPWDGGSVTGAVAVNGTFNGMEHLDNNFPTNSNGLRIRFKGAHMYNRNNSDLGKWWLNIPVNASTDPPIIFEQDPLNPGYISGSLFGSLMPFTVHDAPSGTYKATLSLNLAKGFYLQWDDKGATTFSYRILELATSLANCVATEGTYWSEGLGGGFANGDTLYIHMFDGGGDPTGNVSYEFGHAFVFTSGATQTHNVYFVDLNVFHSVIRGAPISNVGWVGGQWGFDSRRIFAENIEQMSITADLHHHYHWRQHIHHGGAGAVYHSSTDVLKPDMRDVWIQKCAITDLATREWQKDNDGHGWGHQTQAYNVRVEDTNLIRCVHPLVPFTNAGVKSTSMQDIHFDNCRLWHAIAHADGWPTVNGAWDQYCVNFSGSTSTDQDAIRRANCTMDDCVLYGPATYSPGWNEGITSSICTEPLTLTNCLTMGFKRHIDGNRLFDDGGVMRYGSNFIVRNHVFVVEDPTTEDCVAYTVIQSATDNPGVQFLGTGNRIKLKSGDIATADIFRVPGIAPTDMTLAEWKAVDGVTDDAVAWDGRHRTYGATGLRYFELDTTHADYAAAKAELQRQYHEFLIDGSFNEVTVGVNRTLVVAPEQSDPWRRLATDAQDIGAGNAIVAMYDKASLPY